MSKTDYIPLDLSKCHFVNTDSEGSYVHYQTGVHDIKTDKYTIQIITTILALFRNIRPIGVDGSCNSLISTKSAKIASRKDCICKFINDNFITNDVNNYLMLSPKMQHLSVRAGNPMVFYMDTGIPLLDQVMEFYGMLFETYSKQLKKPVSREAFDDKSDIELIKQYLTDYMTIPIEGALNRFKINNIIEILDRIANDTPELKKEVKAFIQTSIINRDNLPVFTYNVNKSIDDNINILSSILTNASFVYKKFNQQMDIYIKTLKDKDLIKDIVDINNSYIQVISPIFTSSLESVSNMPLLFHQTSKLINVPFPDFKIISMVQYNDLVTGINNLRESSAVLSELTAEFKILDKKLREQEIINERMNKINRESEELRNNDLITLEHKQKQIEILSNQFLISKQDNIEKDKELHNIKQQLAEDVKRVNATLLDVQSQLAMKDKELNNVRLEASELQNKIKNTNRFDDIFIPVNKYMTLNVFFNDEIKSNPAILFPLIAEMYLMMLDYPPHISSVFPTSITKESIDTNVDIRNNVIDFNKTVNLLYKIKPIDNSEVFINSLIEYVKDYDYAKTLLNALLKK